MIDLTALNAALENRDLTIKATANGFYQLYDCDNELRLHVKGWNAFVAAFKIDQGEIVTEELGDALTFEPYPTPDQVHHDVYDQVIEWTGDQWVYSFYDEGALFAADTWTRFYEMLVEHLGMSYVIENLHK